MPSKASMIGDMIAEAETRITALQAKIDFEKRYVDRLRELYADENQTERSLPDLMEVILRSVGEPLKNAEICRYLEEATGYKTSSSKGLPSMVSAAVARRTDLFTTTERGVYGLREWLKRETEPTQKVQVDSIEPEDVPF